MVDKIIVYRSQAEANVDALLTSGDAFPYMTALFVGFLVLACTSTYLEKYRFFRRGYNMLLLPAIASLVTLFYLLNKIG